MQLPPLQWVEYPDIEPLSKKYGIRPTGTKLDGSSLCTFPAIYDDATGADPIPIAKYLDATYPETPTAVPAGAEVLMNAFVDAFTSKMMRPFLPALLINLTGVLNPVNAEYRTNLKEVVPAGETCIQAMEMFKEQMASAKKWYDDGNGGKIFVIGDKPIFIDFVVAGVLMGTRSFLGEDGDDRKEISGWRGGHWSKILSEFKGYQVVV